MTLTEAIDYVLVYKKPQDAPELNSQIGNSRELISLTIRIAQDEGHPPHVMLASVMLGAIIGVMAVRAMQEEGKAEEVTVQ